ncbi:unnamed protein product [Closterium sp. NIES-65]|nr:unnamed protein product [Closterium sp. NIES-65]
MWKQLDCCPVLAINLLARSVILLCGTKTDGGSNDRSRGSGRNKLAFWAIPGGDPGGNCRADLGGDGRITVGNRRRSARQQKAFGAAGRNQTRKPAGLLKTHPDEETGKEAEDLPEFNAGLLKADLDEETGKEAEDLPEFNVSYKPQKISPKLPHSVRALLHSKIRDSFHHPRFNTDVLRPMQIDPLLDQEVVNLSGGELQHVAITLCLGNIDPLLHQEVVKISGGELQRVAITLCLGKVRKGCIKSLLGF